MAELSLRTIIKTSVISSFSFAAALIWRDVIIEAIETLFPTNEQLLYKLIVAVLATIIVIIAIYVIIKTEDEAAYLYKTYTKRHKKKKKK